MTLTVDISEKERAAYLYTARKQLGYYYEMDQQTGPTIARKYRETLLEWVVALLDDKGDEGQAR